MSVKYAILATEGADDQAILCSFLKFMGFRSVNYTLKEVDGTFWGGLVPRFPQTKSYHALKNLPYPYIFLSDDYEVAIYQGQGSSLAQNLLDVTQNHPKYKKDISALGIVVDADTHQPTDVAKNYADKLRSSFPSILETPGVIALDYPRIGIYVWPDGRNGGTLETLLLDCASFIYPDHKKGAEHFLNGLDGAHKQREKALVASIVSVLQPGKANYASFAKLDDKWVSELTLEKIAGMKQFWIFLHDLFGLTL